MKALTPILAIVAVLGLSGAGYLYWQGTQTKTQLTGQLSAADSRAGGLQQDLAKANEEKSALAASLARTDGELGDAKRGLTAAEARNVQLAREIDTLKRAAAAQAEEEKKITAEADTLRRELVQLRLAAQTGSPEELERLKQTILTLEGRIAELQSAPASGRAPSVSGSTASSTAPAAASIASARVVQVGPKNAFVVLQLDGAQGVSVGTRFLITRDGAAIAEAAVSSVQGPNAIAQIAASSLKSALVAGDTAALAP